MDNDVLFFFGEYMDALPIYERLEGLIQINPAIGCKLPPKKSGEMNILTQEEMQRFLIQAKRDG